MEHGPLKYYWSRWPSILGLLFISVMGCFMLHWGFYPETVFVNQLGTEWFFWAIGGFFVLFGTGFAINHFFTGHTYYRYLKIFPEDCDKFEKVGNGLLVIYHNAAKVFTHRPHRPDFLIKRGYVEIKTVYNRHKKIKNWWYMDY